MRASLLSHLGSNVVCKSQQAFSSIISKGEMHDGTCHEKA